MKRILRWGAVALISILVACVPRERTLVILSTNDIHAKIQQFPRLATAIKMCRDTAQVVLVDGGDRWTGNAYVDLAAEPGAPILDLMDSLRYDVVTLGNHEFDLGQAYLGRMVGRTQFKVVAANVVSDTCTFPQLPPYVIVERDGLRIGLVGVITNYEGEQTPAGKPESFAGVRFPDPQQMAAKYGDELRPQCDLMLLLSHLGDNRDEEFLNAARRPYDMVIGGHTHKVIDTLINGVRLTQTGKDLHSVGVTVVRHRGQKISSVDYYNLPLSGYEPDAEVQRLVDVYYADPELNKPIGSFSATANKWGLANWMAEAIREIGDAEVGIAHIGGVRLDTIPAGGVSRAQLFDLEPFGSVAVKMRMTPAELRRMIIVKYNDPVNLKEAHRIDLVTTTPYEIITDAQDNALDVRFSALREGRTYRVAMGDYIYRTYKDLHYVDVEVEDERIVDELLDELEDHSPVTPNNIPRQVVRRK